MKYIIRIIIPVVLLFAMMSCENKDWSFPDYAYPTVYFPYQTPARTLVLGDYDLADNTKDNNLQFSIGVTMGGVYENTKDRNIDYVVDETLTQNLFTTSDVRILPLPAAYYTLSPTGTVTIPKGEYSGFIDVQLTDAYLNDTNSYRVTYVVPLRLTDADGDSILQGKPNLGLPNPDIRLLSNWVLAPRNYTLYGIKFINPYHGKYLLRGRDVAKDTLGTPVDTVVYHAKFVEDNAIRALKTVGRYKVEVTGAVRKESGSQGNYTAEITFSANGDCTITQKAGSAFPVTGTGKFVEDAEEWGGKKRNTLYLNFQVTDAAHYETHQVNDTLVIRDRDVRFETFAVKVVL